MRKQPQRELVGEGMAYHRNGIAGTGFYVTLINEKEEGSDEWRRMVVIRVPDADKATGTFNCFALDVNKMRDHSDVQFFSNSWRGDHYVEFMDAEIKKYNRRKNETRKTKDYVGVDVQ